MWSQYERQMQQQNQEFHLSDRNQNTSDSNTDSKHSDNNKETQLDADTNPVPVIPDPLAMNDLPVDLYQPVKANPHLNSSDPPRYLTPIESNHQTAVVHHSDPPPSYVSVTRPNCNCTPNCRFNSRRCFFIFVIIFILVAITTAFVVKRLVEPKLCTYGEFASECKYECGVGNHTDSVVLVMFESTHKCLGTIISKRRILTASECGSNRIDPTYFSVRLASAFTSPADLRLYPRKSVRSIDFYIDVMILELDSDIDPDYNRAACLPYESSTYPKFKSSGMTVYSSFFVTYDLNLVRLGVSQWYHSMFSNYRYSVEPLFMGCQRMGAPLFTQAVYGNKVRFVLAGIALNEGCTIITQPFQEYAQISESNYFRWIKSNVLMVI